MRAVKSRSNRTTELRVVELLKAFGLRGWRRHLEIPGRPDFAWRAERVAIFVDGCFWHGCPHCRKPMPRANAAYWEAKIARNVARDRRVRRELRSCGWSVITVWEHALRAPNGFLARLRGALESRR